MAKSDYVFGPMIPISAPSGGEVRPVINVETGEVILEHHLPSGLVSPLWRYQFDTQGEASSEQDKPVPTT